MVYPLPWVNFPYWIIFINPHINCKTEGELPALCNEIWYFQFTLASHFSILKTTLGNYFRRGSYIQKDEEGMNYKAMRKLRTVNFRKKPCNKDW
jgi:hypothetical protein